MFSWFRSEKLLAKAMLQTDAGQTAAAIATYRELLQISPNCGPAWFNLGLIAKQKRDWDEMRACNLRAVQIDPANQPAWWNLGTAATALRDWSTASNAWGRFGLDVPPGEGPVFYPAGMTPIRLNPDGDGEVVWCERIDPVRAVIRNIPFPASGHRWGDIVLHDGEPKGERRLKDQSLPVFDELEGWEPSTVPTVSVGVRAADAADIAALQSIFEEEDHLCEDWTGTVRMICRACSEGSPHEHVTSGSWENTRSLGLACTLSAALPLLERWSAAGPGRELDSAEVVG